MQIEREPNAYFFLAKDKKEDEMGMKKGSLRQLNFFIKGYRKTSGLSKPFMMKKDET